MEKPIKSTEYKDYTIEIYQDEDPKSPREWDNFGHMICFHSQYDLGDKHDFKTPPQLMEVIHRKDVLSFPLVLLDHSGLTIKIGTSYIEDPGGWDTSKVGYIYVTYDEIKKEYGNAGKKNKEKAADLLRSEVEVYNQYLTGEVYGYIIKDAWGKVVDSCWGFYEKPDQLITECKSMVDRYKPKPDTSPKHTHDNDGQFHMNCARCRLNEVAPKLLTGVELNHSKCERKQCSVCDLLKYVGGVAP